MSFWDKLFKKKSDTETETVKKPEDSEASESEMKEQPVEETYDETGTGEEKEDGSIAA
ncbi:MAG: hypothetical protein QXX01_03330 [Candidatus Aenigmatarchaeota archaeon]